MRHAILCILTLSLLVVPAYGTIWHVPADTPTIQSGLDLAQPGDTVIVACGAYYEHNLLMTSGVTLRSETGEADCVVIDAQQIDRVMLCEWTELGTAIIGVTFTGGNRPGSYGHGAGLLCEDSTLDLTNCVFANNYSGYGGGGAFTERSNLTITNCIFEDNEAYMHGGGLGCHEGEQEISGCKFLSNIATDGAGLYCTHTSPKIDGCVFINNDGMVFGGGIFCISYSSLVVTNCTLVGNSAHVGAGIMVAYESYPSLDNCIIAFNEDGAGVHVDYSVEVPSWAYMTCCDVYDNSEGGYSGLMEDQTGLNGNIANDPLFCDLEAGDLTVAMQSPCLPENNECGVLMGALGEGCVALPVEETPPAVFRLAQNRPNPFNPTTMIEFDLPGRSPVLLAVYTLAGRHVVTLIDLQVLAGRQEVVWNGRDSLDQQVPSGSYFYKLEAGDYSQTKRMTLIR